jgi:tRNA threonylcarbamoyladenosine biosynthesis protein TsaB
MIILCLATDQPEAYLGLYEDSKLFKEVRWLAHRELSNTIFEKLQSLLVTQKLTIADIEGFVCYKGPGSFTGLRIGLSAINALAFAGSHPVVTSEGESWIAEGINRLLNGENEKIAMPHYGAEANITIAKK